MPKKLRAGILAATDTVGQRFIELLAYHPNFEIAALAARVVEPFGRREWSAFVAQVDRFRECAGASEEETL